MDTDGPNESQEDPKEEQQEVKEDEEQEQPDGPVPIEQVILLL